MANRFKTFYKGNKTFNLRGWNMNKNKTKLYGLYLLVITLFVILNYLLNQYVNKSDKRVTRGRGYWHCWIKLGHMQFIYLVQ